MYLCSGPGNCNGTGDTERKGQSGAQRQNQLTFDPWDLYHTTQETDWLNKDRKQVVLKEKEAAEVKSDQRLGMREVLIFLLQSSLVTGFFIISLNIGARLKRCIHTLGRVSLYSERATLITPPLHIVCRQGDGYIMLWWPGGRVLSFHKWKAGKNRVRIICISHCVIV